MSNGHGGRRIGAGRKTRRQEDELRKILDEAWPPADRIEVIKKIVERALYGLEDQLKSAALLLGYAYGRPVAMDAQEIELRVNQEIEGILESLKSRLDGTTFKKVVAALSET
jgi:hypothetical protein